MDFVLSLVNPFLYISMPSTVLGWVGWGVSFILLVFCIWHWWKPARFPLKKTWLIFGGLLLLIPLTSLFLGFRFSPGTLGNHPTLGGSGLEPAFMILSAVPWILAGGLLGPGFAAVLGIVSGLLLGFIETHNLFTLIENGFLAFLFGICVQQRYRTSFYRFLRHPMGSVVFLSILQIPILMFTTFFAVNGPVASRLDYAFTQTWPTLLTHAAALLVAGLIAEAIYLYRPQWWSWHSELIPSPSETNLQMRLLYGSIPYILLLVFVLIVSDWIVAIGASKRMVEEQLSNSAAVAAESLPTFFETGQNLIATYASPELVSLPPEELSKELSDKFKSVKFFSQLFVFNAAGNPILGFPSNDIQKLGLSGQERAGMGMAQQGRLIQVFTVPPRISGMPAEVAFMAAIRDQHGVIQGILLGRSDLGSNFLTTPAIRAMQNMAKVGGEGMILDEKNIILYHTNPAMIYQPYYGTVERVGGLYNDISSTGKHHLSYAAPVPNSTWSVLLSVPAEHSQQTAMTIAMPLLIVLVAIALISFIAIRLALGGVLNTVHVLGEEAQRIADGELNHPITVQDIDEVGKLGKTLEAMRTSLQARLSELNGLLHVSQGVAKNLHMEDAIEPILIAAKISDDAMVRVVLETETGFEVGETEKQAYGIGADNELYQSLDLQLFELLKQRDTIGVPNTQRWKGVQFDLDAKPGALYAFALNSEDQYHGVMWLGFAQPKVLSEPVLQYLSTLAGQTAIAASNSNLFASAEVGRQRLEAVLASTPEPVLVTDEQDRLFLLNPAALQVTGLLQAAMPGLPITEAVAHKELIDLIKSVELEKPVSMEIVFPDEKVYSASIAPIANEEKVIGKVALLRDITSYKELDKLKTEFVENVSHDLRSPLTMMRGYVTMLQMVGPLNEQQNGYANKITASVERISDLVNNLLDLSRIEAGVALKIDKLVIEEVIEQAAASLQPQAMQKKIEMELESIKESQTVIEGDRALLFQAIYNLLENGIKYTAVNGSVSTRLTQNPDSVVIEIQDTGIGISPIDLPHMFEKFYRSGRSEAASQRGTGLGLAIVHSIVERHGGKTAVNSLLGKGSTFSIEIPRRQSLDAE